MAKYKKDASGTLRRTGDYHKTESGIPRRSNRNLKNDLPSDGIPNSVPLPNTYDILPFWARTAVSSSDLSASGVATPYGQDSLLGGTLLNAPGKVVSSNYGNVNTPLFSSLDSGVISAKTVGIG